MSFRSIVAAALLLFGAAAAAPAGESFTLAPPLPWALGERFTPHSMIVDWFEDLAAAHPDRVELVRFGETWERRPLVYAVIASPENRARLAEIRAAMATLADPRRAPRAEAERLAESMPAVVWLGFGVHGDESSSAEAAMMVADRLLRDQEAVRLLQNLVVIIDPLQNPDGRERYITWFEGRVGRDPDPDPEALEHYQPWPGGRYNHYLVDMNRDWLWTTQRESKARVDAYLAWRPQVFVDFHEMGYESSYFFPPDADPVNTNIDPATKAWLERFGTANAEAFSSRGWPFFVAEHFDLFYPGYGDSWPSLHGAIGMTFEMAGHGFAGRAVEREDGTTLTLRDRIERHFTSAMGTLATAAANRRELLLHSRDTVERQLAQPETTYLVKSGSRGLQETAELLRQQRIEFSVLARPRAVSAASVLGGARKEQEFPAGTLVVSTRQPHGAIVRTLFEKSPAIDPKFIEAQRERVQADEPDQFYDITAWSLPVAFGVDAFALEGRVPADALAPAPAQNAVAAPQQARFGWVVDARDPELYRLIGELLRREIRFSVVSDELEHGKRTFARGSILIQRYNNGEDILARLGDAVNAAPASLAALDTAWSGGLALGSGKVVNVRDPRIAIVGGTGTTSTAYGHTWHAFDQVTRIPYTSLALDRLASADLSKFRVLILPDGSGYATLLGKRGFERLKSWIEDGNTLVAIGRSARALRSEEAGISKTRLWEPAKEEGEKGKDAPKRYTDFNVPGAAFRTEMNRRSFLTFGLSAPPPVLVQGSDVVLPVAHTIDNIVTIPQGNALLAGFAWPESIERLEGSAWLVVEPVGRGRVITFAGDPFFRSFWHGTLPLLLNAAVYSPSF
ncbi:MAG TPA: M14 metallopeptidase family protein [Thermoanaerobaculia bacterium]